MKVLITGATGLIGKEIIKHCLKNNIKVNYLTTSKSKIKSSVNYQGFYWSLKDSFIDTSCFDDVDVIIHLAGATIAKRWTTSYKKEIISSRKDTTQLLINALKHKKHNIKQIISASAIGIYPDSITNFYDENFQETSSSFLGNVTALWEQEVDTFSELNIVISKIRIGLVLSNKGGALLEMTRPIRLGIGAAFSDGKQWQSWIHIHDLAKLFLYVLNNELPGVYNAVAPNPVTNLELTRSIANILKRPLFLPHIPKWLVKLILGDMHILLFESQRVSSKKIENNGFQFKYHHLEPALLDLLKR